MCSIPRFASSTALENSVLSAVCGVQKVDETLRHRIAIQEIDAFRMWQRWW